MPAITPCYRHARRAWIAACADCTAWHLAGVIGRNGDRAFLNRSADRSAYPPH